MGIAEPFTTTVTISAYAAIVISLPVILYQAYAFVLPALTTRERRYIVPFLILAPGLFVAGVVFGYFVVLPAATKFLLNFNDNQFNIQIRARDYYSFFTLTLGVMGLIFELPIAIIAVARLGIVTPEQLPTNRHYAYLILAVVAMLLPGTDPVSMLLELVPLLLLYGAACSSPGSSAGRRTRRENATSRSPSPRPAGRRRPAPAFISASACSSTSRPPVVAAWSGWCSAASR